MPKPPRGKGRRWTAQAASPARGPALSALARRAPVTISDSIPETKDCPDRRIAVTRSAVNRAQRVFLRDRHSYVTYLPDRAARLPPQSAPRRGFRVIIELLGPGACAPDGQASPARDGEAGASPALTRNGKRAARVRARQPGRPPGTMEFRPSRKGVGAAPVRDARLASAPGPVAGVLIQR